MARGKRRRRDEEEEQEEESEQEIAPSDPDELEEELEEEQQLGGEGEQQDDEAGPSSSKRQRSEYPRGTVKKVRVYNFMTYGTPAVEITPGPRLNLVLGPNGTGKSSLVCALCLGLTGAPKLLGRADNLKDFIRRGADSGWVETTLSGGPGRPDRVVRCEMRKTAEGYSTSWRINGVAKPMRDVKDLVKDMNIQFDNLCQFLPQDKVVEFARLNPYELLVATEKAIGDASLHDTHMQLIEQRNAMKLREQRRAAEQAAHDQLVSQNQGLERDYQRFEKRQKLVKSIAIIRKKLAWMDVKDAQEKARLAEQEAKDKAAALKEAQQAAKGDERPARQREQAALAARQAMGVAMQEVRKQEGRVKKAMERAAQEEQAVRQLRTQISSLAADSQSRSKGIEVLRKKVQLVHEKLDQFGPIPDHSAEVRQLMEQQAELRDQVSSLEDDKVLTLNELSHQALQKSQKEGALREVASAAWQRMSAIISCQGRLYRFGDNLRQLTQWVALQRASGLFRGQVVGPLGCEVKVRPSVNGQPLNPKWVSNLEQAVWAQMPNFAVQTRDDERLLMAELKRAGLDSVKVVVVTQDLDTPIASHTQELTQYGVVASLNELFDAPPLVRHALNNVCNLDGTYVVSRHEVEEAKKMMEAHAGVGRVYTPEVVLTYVRSAYGTRDDSSVKTGELKTSQILRTGASADADERKRQLEAELAAILGRIAELEAKQRAAEEAIAPLHAQIEALQDQIKGLHADTNQKAASRRKLQQGLKMAEKLLADKEASPDPLQQAPQLERQLKAALKKHHAAVTETLAATADNWSALQKHVVAELTTRELDMQAKAMLQHHQEQRRVVTVLEGELRTAQAKSRALADAFRRAKESAEEDHPLDAAARKAFGEISDDREELSQDLSELEVQVDNITVSNPRVAQEYRQRKDQIEAKARELAELQTQLDMDAQQLDQLKASWLPALQRVVGLINASFSTNFSEIGCAGEVALQQDEDYDKFSIQIKVKFREDEQLQLLTAHRQSGGERSVSTILYLIALQGVTVTPFRVVDEINQGMDPANERKVFEQLVTASCKEGTPQCFLLTPKLLPDLPFTEDITVLNIFNGSLIAEAVVERFSAAKLFGSSGLAQLRGAAVPVAG